MPETTPEALLNYLRQHGKRYSLEALRHNLVTFGHDPVQVDAALAAYRAELEGPGAPPAASGCTLSSFLFGLFLLVMNGFLGLQILTGTVHASPSGHLALTLWIGLLVGELGLGIWAASAGREPAVRVLGVGMILGAVLTGTLFLLLAGVCAKINSVH